MHSFLSLVCNDIVLYTCKSYLLKTRVGLSNLWTRSAYSNSKVWSEADMASGSNTKLEDLGPWSRSLCCPGGYGSIVDSSRCLFIRRSDTAKIRIYWCWNCLWSNTIRRTFKSGTAWEPPDILKFTGTRVAPWLPWVNAGDCEMGFTAKA